MKDWIKRSNSKKLSDNDVIYCCEELQSKPLGDATRLGAYVKGNGNYLNNILKSLRGQRRTKPEEEVNPFAAEIESDKKVAVDSESKIDLEQILAKIEMKVTNNSQRGVASFGLNSYPIFINVNSDIEMKSSLEAEKSKELKFADEYSNVFQPEMENGDTEDPVYSSRKLLIRQLLNNELRDIESGMDEDRLSVDSWSEMEKSFTKIYEPLPLPLEFVPANARMSKEELLQSIPDKKLRSELSRLEHSDITYYLKNLSKVPSAARPRPLPACKEKLMIEVEVDNFDRDATSERLLGKPPEMINEERDNDTLSWKSISINSDGSEEEPFYVSRSEILARTQPPVIYALERDHISSSSFVSEVVNLPFSPVSRSAIIKNVSQSGRRGGRGRCRKVEDGGDFDNEGLSSNSVDSWSLEDFELPDDESMVGDRNIGSIYEDSFAKIMTGQRQPQRREDQGLKVERIPDDSWNDSDMEQLSQAQILSTSVDKTSGLKKPLPALELRKRVQKFLALHPCIGRPTKEKVMLILKDHIEQCSSASDTTEAANKNKEVRDRLKEAFANDWENMSNVSLGFIYVPMEENAKLMKAPNELVDYDTFGSIDSLIFEPKSLSSTKSLPNGDQVTLPPFQESLSFVPEDEQLHNYASSPPSIDLDAHLQRQVTHCLQSSASTEGLSHPYSTAPDGSNVLQLISTHPELSDCLESGVTDNAEFFNHFAGSSQSSLTSPFRNEYINFFGNDDKKTSTLQTAYHPDDIKRTSCRDPIFSSSSSPDESGSVSDTDSVTSVDSVIVNMKGNLPEKNNNVKRPTSKKKYIVNRGQESDSNSDLDAISTQQTQLLDIDTSWDYIATPISESTKTEGFSHNIYDCDQPHNFGAHSREQFTDYLANSHFHSSLAKEIHLEDVAKAQYESSEDSPKVSAEDNVSDGPTARVVLLKHHVYQSIESLQSLLSSSDSENHSLPQFGSVRSEAIPGAANDEIFFESNPEEAPFLINYGDELSLPEEIIKLNQGRKDDTMFDAMSSEPLLPNTAIVHLDSVKNSKVNQKMGNPMLRGTGKNALMIQELKLKLRKKFLSGEEDDNESISLKSRESFDVASLIVSSIECKRKLLEPLIFKSINLNESKSHPTLTKKESCPEIRNECPAPEPLEIEDPVFFDASDSSLVWVPTPDYTPLSTLPKNLNREECLLLPFPDLEDFVRSHLIKASLEKRLSDSAFDSEESRARRARSRSPKRSVRFDTSRKLPETLGATWSDLESVIFAEEKSAENCCDETGRPDSRLTNSQASCKLPCTRMESYKDEWLLWDQLAKMRRSKTPEDRERWQSEKTKRMLLWVHLSNNNSHIEWCYKSHWWKAKQRASVAWIVQKCHKNKVPSDFEEPYYKDYEGLEHLKPGIVHRLSNADMYCSALANIYGDPNFHNLSHWNIIQALARKGVYVAEPTDVALTETVLIQTTPIKMSAHLAVIEAMMALYIREVVVAKRVVQAIQRISGISQTQDIPPQDQEEALVLWVDHSTQALQSRIQQQVQQNQDQELPVFPKIQDLSDLSDGIGLAALLAFYCPQELSWGDIAVADPPSMADSLYNIGLVIKFCKDSLPYNPCLLTKEDIVYMHSSVKQNILAFVAELFFLMELEPVSCVSCSNTKKTSSKYIQLSSPGMRPAGVPSVRRSHSMNLNDASDSRSRAESRSENAPSSHNSDYGGRDSSMSDGQDNEFLVQKAKGYATLNDMMRNHSPHPSQHDNPSDLFGTHNISKEKYNTESKDEELGERGKLNRRGSFYGSINDLNELPPAGIPTRLENRPIGRSRSRRNSINADESQLTIENFGGSQDNLNYISRNPDKEPYIHSGKRESFHEIFPRRSASQSRETDKANDHNRSSVDELDNRVMDKLERDALEREKRGSHYSSKETLQRKDHRRRSQPERVESSSESEASYEAEKPIGKATSFAELSKLKEQLPGGINIIYMQQPEKEDVSCKTHSKGSEKKTTTFAALPNQTTWKQQSFQNQVDSDGADDNYEPQVVTSELHNVRLKLEEKRRRIEAEKRKMELMLSKQRQKLGKEAFMQAVVKGDLGTEVSNVSKKWLANEGPKEDLKTPDMDTMDYDEYQKSLSQMTDSLTEIQSDIQRLSQQQHQIQTLMKNGMVSQPNQFYLHDQQESPARRMWSQHSSSDGYSSMSPATRRAQWGPPARPIIPQGEYLMGGSQQPASYYSYQTSPNMAQPHQLPPMNQLGQPPAQPNQGGFLLHGQPHSLPAGHQANSVYQNGQTYFPPEYFRGYQAPNYMVDPSRGSIQSQGGNAPPFRLHQEGGGDESRGSSGLRSSAHSSPSHQTYQRFQKSPSPSRQVSHAPVAAPPPDDMEPQNVCFIEEQKQNQLDAKDKLKNLSISSGSRTYRISHEPGSPTRPPIGTKTFRVPTKRGTPVYDDADLPQPSHPQRSSSPSYNKNDTDNLSGLVHVEPLVEGLKADKGFYISLDDEGPKRPKPPLRLKKLSQKKSSGSLTLLTTPTREESPSIYQDHDKENKSALMSPTYNSMKLRRSSSRGLNADLSSPVYPNASTSHFTTRSDLTLSPSSSASSVLRDSSPSSYWNFQAESNSRKNSHINKLNSSRFNYGGLQNDGSNSDSDLAHDDSFRVHKKSDPKSPHHGTALVIGEDLVNEDSSLSEMEKKKEKLMMMSIRRKQQQEEMKRKKEIEAEMKREEEKKKEDDRMRKKEEEKARRELILEKHKIKKAIEEAEKEGRYYVPPAWYYDESSATSTPNNKSSVRLRNRGSGGSKPRPKTMHEASFSGSDERLSASRGKKGSSHNISEPSSNTRKINGRWGSSGSLPRAVGNRGSTGSLGPDYSSSSISRGVEKTHSGRRPTSVIGDTGSLVRRERSRGSLYGSRGVGLNEREEDSYQVHENRRPSVASNRRSRLPCYDGVTGRKYRSTGSLYGPGDHDSLLYHVSEDSGLGRATPPRRAPSPGMSSRHLPSPSGPGSLPPGLFSRRRPGAFDDNMSDISTTSSNMDYCGPRLFKQPTAKSNRNIILNAVEYCVFPGVVNQTSKHRVLEEVGRSEAKHFLILFRDSGCQFRALYSYNPDLEEVYKLYGTGPKQITDRMFEKFFKYNSGGKCFSQIHTKHLTVTIDAFTIHNSLWQGKKVNLPSKKDMKLVI